MIILLWGTPSMKTDESWNQSRLEGHSFHHTDSYSSSGKVCFEIHVALFTNTWGSRFQEQRSIGTVSVGNLCRLDGPIESCDEAPTYLVPAMFRAIRLTYTADQYEKLMKLVSVAKISVNSNFLERRAWSAMFRMPRDWSDSIKWRHPPQYRACVQRLCHSPYRGLR